MGRAIKQSVIKSIQHFQSTRLSNDSPFTIITISSVVAEKAFISFGGYAVIGAATLENIPKLDLRNSTQVVCVRNNYSVTVDIAFSVIEYY